MVYCAEHPALAALEVRVHLDLPFELLPNDYVLLRATVPDGLIADIDDEPEARTVAMGDAWLIRGDTAALRVPSVLVPYAWNILLNPRHRDADRARIAAIAPFRFDPRLWQPLGAEG